MPLKRWSGAQSALVWPVVRVLTEAFLRPWYLTTCQATRKHCWCIPKGNGLVAEVAPYSCLAQRCVVMNGTRSLRESVPGGGNLRHACHTWHAKRFLMARRCSMFCIYRCCYDSRRRFIDLDLYKNTCVVGKLNDLKPSSRRTVSIKVAAPGLYPYRGNSWGSSKLVWGCHPREASNCFLNEVTGLESSDLVTRTLLTGLFVASPRARLEPGRPRAEFTVHDEWSWDQGFFLRWDIRWSTPHQY